MNEDLAKLLGGGGLAAALLYLLYLVGMRLVAAIDRIAIKIDDHGSKIDEHGHELARIGTKMDMLVPEDPPVQVRRERTGRTPVRGVEAGSYGPMRPSTRSDGR